MRARRVEEEGEEDAVEEEHDKDGGEVAGLIDNLTIETAGTEEEAAKGLEAALVTQEMEVEGDGESKGEEGGHTPRGRHRGSYPRRRAETGGEGARSERGRGKRGRRGDGRDRR